MNDELKAGSACSLSHRERGGVRGFELSISGNPLTPTLSPNGERECTAVDALFERGAQERSITTFFQTRRPIEPHAGEAFANIRRRRAGE